MKELIAHTQQPCDNEILCKPCLCKERRENVKTILSCTTCAAASARKSVFTQQISLIFFNVFYNY